MIEIRAFSISLQLMLRLTSNNIIVGVVFHQNYMNKLHKRASTSYWILGRFDLSQNGFDMRRAKIELRRDL